MKDPPNWERLGAAVEARRSRLGMTQKAVADNGGPSDTTISKIEKNDWNPSRGVKDTLDKLDSGLDWEPGSASNVLAGGDPIPTGTKLTSESPADRDAAEIHAPVVADGWRAVTELTDAVLCSGPTDQLLEKTRRVVFVMSGYLIIRILESGRAAEMQQWLERIYLERQLLYKRLWPGVGEPDYPWFTPGRSADDPQPSGMLSHFAAGQDARVLRDKDGEERDQGLG